VLAGAMQHVDGSQCDSGDFVLMPNHVHWVVQPLDPFDLEMLIGSIKKWACRHMDVPESLRGRVWQKESYDHIARNREELNRIRNYIQTNPQKAGLSHRETTDYRASWLDETAAAPGVMNRPPAHQPPS
jgi:REP element-mobilizing transposase RayT